MNQNKLTLGDALFNSMGTSNLLSQATTSFSSSTQLSTSSRSAWNRLSSISNKNAPVIDSNFECVPKELASRTLVICTTDMSSRSEITYTLMRYWIQKFYLPSTIVHMAPKLCISGSMGFLFIVLDSHDHLEQMVTEFLRRSDEHGYYIYRADEFLSGSIPLAQSRKRGAPQHVESGVSTRCKRSNELSNSLRSRQCSNQSVIENDDSVAAAILRAQSTASQITSIINSATSPSSFPFICLAKQLNTKLDSAQQVDLNPLVNYSGADTVDMSNIFSLRSMGIFNTPIHSIDLLDFLPATMTNVPQMPIINSGVNMDNLSTSAAFFRKTSSLPIAALPLTSSLSHSKFVLPSQAQHFSLLNLTPLFLSPCENVTLNHNLTSTLQ